MEPFEELNALYYKKMHASYPNFPKEYIVNPKYKNSSANSLTRCIVEFLNMSGHQAERISNTGSQIDERKTCSDTLGNARTIGSVKWIKGTGTNGSSDISATIKGRSVKIEIKIGRDVQSEAQKEYQASIETAGGIYFIATSFEQFHQFYTELLIKIS